MSNKVEMLSLYDYLGRAAGEKLGKRFKVSPFDEIYGEEASRILVNQKLKEASMKKNSIW